VDAVTTKILWSDFTYTFDHLSENGPVVYDVRIHPRKYFLIDAKRKEGTVSRRGKSRKKAQTS